MDKYPEDFIIGDYDNEYGHTLSDIKNALKKLVSRFAGDDEETGLEKMADKMWAACAITKDSLKERHIKKFIKAIVARADHTMVVGERFFEEVYNHEEKGEAVEGMLGDKNEKKSKKDILDFLKQMTE